MRHANITSNTSAPIMPPLILRQRASDAARVANDERSDREISVQTGAKIFELGDGRKVFQIERGAVCHFQRWSDGRVDVIEFAFPGDIIGLGYLADHTSSAVAMVDTVVRVMPTETLEQRLVVDDRLALSLAAAGEREFEFLRAKSARTALLPPLQKVANYLLAIASIEQSEGRASVLVSDEVASGFVASQLRMSIDTLSMALLSLRRSGILDLSGNRLTIVDVDRLESVAATSN